MKLFIILIALAWTTGCLQASGGVFKNINPANLYSYLEKTNGYETTNNNFCQGCRSMVSFVTRFNSTQHSEENEKLFSGFCELYYPPSTDFRLGPCPNAVKLLLQYLRLIDPVHHCDQIGACGDEYVDDDNNDDRHSLISNFGDVPPTVSNMVCDFCEQIIEQFQKQLQDPRFLDLLHNQVNAFCDYLRIVDMDKECRQMAGKYIDQALDFIGHIQPEKYCKSIQLCSAAWAAKKQKQKQLSTATLASFHGFGLETNVELNGQVVRNIDNINKPSVYVSNSKQQHDDDNSNEQALTHHKNGPNCMVCKLIVREVSRLIKNNKSEEFIEDSLKRVCTLVFKRGSAQEEQCDEMVTAYTKELIELMADESNPEVVCMLIEQCTYQQENKKNRLQNKSKTIQEELLSTQSVTTLVDKASESDEENNFGQFIAKMNPEIAPNSLRGCVECKLFIRYLQETFQDQKSRDSFKEYLLENLCQSLKEQEIKDSCTKMVNQYADYFFKAIAEELDPATVCIDLKACKKRRENVFLIQLLSPAKQTSFEEEDVNGFVPPAEKPLDSYRSAICDECVDVITKLDDYLSTHSVDHDMNALIEQVCKKLPDQQSQDTCSLIVKTLGQKIIETLHTMDNPKQACQSIYLC